MSWLLHIFLNLGGNTNAFKLSFNNVLFVQCSLFKFVLGSFTQYSIQYARKQFSTDAEQATASNQAAKPKMLTRDFTDSTSTLGETYVKRVPGGKVGASKEVEEILTPSEKNLKVS